MATKENYTTQDLTNMLTHLMAATKKGAITREACVAANGCAGDIILLVSLRFQAMDMENIEVTAEDNLELGAMPALKPLFDSVEANDSRAIIAEAKRIRGELDPIYPIIPGSSICNPEY